MRRPTAYSDFPIYGLDTITLVECDSPLVADEHELVINICKEER